MEELQEYYGTEFYTKHQVSDASHAVKYGMHIHKSYELYWLAKGEGTYLVEGTHYPLAPGMLLLMRPGEVHMPQMVGDAPYERYVVNFTAELLQDIDPEGRLLRPLDNRPLGMGNLYTREELSDLALEQLFAEICAEREDTYARELNVRVHLLALLAGIKTAYDRRAGNAAPVERDRMVAYVNAHLSEPLSLREIAAHFYRSTSQFTRTFKAATGVAPWTYIQAKRLHLAAEKLQRGVPLKTVFAESGFSDYSAFYRAYVKAFGHAPTK